MAAGAQKQPTIEPQEELSPAEALRHVKEHMDKQRLEVGKAIIGKDEVIKMVQVGLLANSHILFEDFPGLAKSLMAMTFSDVLGCKFKRIQFTPDLLPTDISGTYIYDESENEFKFRPGPIFANLVLADEINRAPPKTQAAMLEAMQERQVTIEGVTHKLPKPFIVLATQNPVEQEGTYPLPEAQLDRFIMKMSVGYPARADEMEILNRRFKRKKDEVDVDTLSNPTMVLNLINAVEHVHISQAILRYIVEIVQRTREDQRIHVGASPRGSQALFKLSRAYAAISGRDYVIPDDVKVMAIPGLKHRLILKPQIKVKGIPPEDIVADILENVPVPTV